MTDQIRLLRRSDRDDPAFSIGADALLRGEETRAALWWTHTPPVAGEKPGVIGRFYSENKTAALQLLDKACTTLGNEGCTVVLGPMDGTTWRPYRFLTWRGSVHRFVLEPDQPLEWPEWWRMAGFSAREEYISTMIEIGDVHDCRLDAVREKLNQGGVRIRPLNMMDFEGEMRRIFTVSEAAFRRNVLYAPLSENEFLLMYAQVRPFVNSALVLIAECGPIPVGFIFAIPDAEQAKRGEPVNTVVIKTLAVLPGRAYAGLGKILLETCQRAAHGFGFRRAIHALMHAANGSRNLGEGAHEIRRYTLFEKSLR